MNRFTLTLLILALFATVAFAATKSCTGADNAAYTCDSRESCCTHKNKDTSAVTKSCCRDYQECCDGACCNKLTQWCLKTRNPDLPNTRYCSTAERPSATAAMKIVIPPAVGFIVLLTVYIYSIVMHKGKGRLPTTPFDIYVAFAILTSFEFGLLQMFSFTASWAWTFFGAVTLGFALYAQGLKKNSYLYTSLIFQGVTAAMVVGIIPIFSTAGNLSTDLNGANDGNRGFFYPFQSMNNKADACRNYYDGYFGLDANLINQYKENANHTWGYCSQGFLGTQILLGLIFVMIVCINSVITGVQILRNLKPDAPKQE